VKRALLLVALGLVVGAALSAVFGLPFGRGSCAGPVPEPAGGAADRSAELDELRLALDHESIEREMLAAEVELMRSVIEQIALERVEPVPPREGRAAAAGAAARSSKQLQLDEERLLELGLVESEVRVLRERWDVAQLAKLDLRDRATREGWLMRPRHRLELDRIGQALRTELGDEAYDQMLYATQQSNRAVVQSVIGGSVAERAGLQPGDEVISYASERIFAPQELSRLTTQGVRGESIRVTFDRGGQRISAVVPRGPLGVRLTARRSPPAR